MRFTLTIQCDNEAFAHTPMIEVRRILADAATWESWTLGLGAIAFQLRDINGNAVGTAELTED